MKIIKALLIEFRVITIILGILFANPIWALDANNADTYGFIKIAFIIVFAIYLVLAVINITALALTNVKQQEEEQSTEDDGE